MEPSNAAQDGSASTRFLTQVVVLLNLQKWLTVFELHHRGHSFFSVLLCFQYKLMSGGLNTKTVTVCWIKITAHFFCVWVVNAGQSCTGGGRPVREKRAAKACFELKMGAIWSNISTGSDIDVVFSLDMRQKAVPFCSLRHPENALHRNLRQSARVSW